MIRKRVRLREALLPSDGRLIIASSDGLLDRSAENSDAVGLTVEAIGYLPLFRLVLRNRPSSCDRRKAGREQPRGGAWQVCDRIRAFAPTRPAAPPCSPVEPR